MRALRTTLLTLALIVLAGPGLTGAAQREQAPRPGQQSAAQRRAGQQRNNDPLAKLAGSMQALNLSAEQKQKITELVAAGRPALERARAAHTAATRALNQAAAKESGEKVIMEAAAKVGKALGVMTVQRVKLMAQLRSVLNAEQQAQLKKRARPQRGNAQAKPQRQRPARPDRPAGKRKPKKDKP